MKTDNTANHTIILPEYVIKTLPFHIPPPPSPTLIWLADWIFVVLITGGSIAETHNCLMLLQLSNSSNILAVKHIFRVNLATCNM